MRIRLNPLQVTGVDFDFNMQTEYLRSARAEIINSSGILGYERQADRVNEEDTLIPRHPVPDRLPPVGQAPLHVADCDMNWELSGCRSDRVLAAHTTTTVRTCHFTEALESIIGLNAAEGIKKRLRALLVN